MKEVSQPIRRVARFFTFSLFPRFFFFFSPTSVRCHSSLQDIATALNTTTSELFIDDVVFSSTSTSDIDTPQAATTFFGVEEVSASGAAVGLALTFNIVVVVVFVVVVVVVVVNCRFWCFCS